MYLFSKDFVCGCALFTKLQNIPISVSTKGMICHQHFTLQLFIVLQILWVVQFNWFQWVLVIVGTLLSGGVLVLTFWPALKEDNLKVTKASLKIS